MNSLTIKSYLSDLSIDIVTDFIASLAFRKSLQMLLHILHFSFLEQVLQVGLLLTQDYQVLYYQLWLIFTLNLLSLG